MFECCFTFSILTALLSGILIGMVATKCSKYKPQDDKNKFPPAPVIAGVV